MLGLVADGLLVVAVVLGLGVLLWSVPIGVLLLFQLAAVGLILWVRDFD
jgi:hypothetical protein